MPFSVRRHELNDLNGDGLKEFFLLGSREDGRGRSRKDYLTMFDKNFIYNFERDEITTFGVPTFSHDYGIHDFHFYTLNRADLTYAICHILGLRPHKK